ncbi:PTS sugar transporter subunit IIC/EAL domain-containing protein [Treponema sp. UBA3813]|uniref:PTS sugar transporter subunit IIC/EAL domain-containing protein n=1 Tax=Treponema sp. UBA3813 TaxID=1947715 RepID=UPI0025EACB74|nr:EAL domain-containing protein [Treponema sp. UBA3813]
MKTRFAYFWTLVSRTIRNGLVMVLPVLLIGSFSVLLVYFPIPAYQKFISTFWGGAIQNLLFMVQLSTLGLLPVYMTASINLSFTALTEDGQRLSERVSSLLSALTCFFISTGVFSSGFNILDLSSQGLFSSLLAGVFASVLYQKFELLFKKRMGLFIEGADSAFTSALGLMLPYLCTVLVFLFANFLITVIFGVSGIQDLFIKAVTLLFSKMHRSYASGFLFILLSTALWGIGIHGNKVLDSVAVGMFSDIIPGETVSKTFIDTFSFMGGTGTTLGLVIALFIFARTSNSKKLARLALAPSLFNIGELVVFGFPVIFNPYLIVPFIIAPEVCYSFTYFFTKIGFLPQVVGEVNWTTPIFLSGFLATGSVRAIFVQVLNIAVSVAIYTPFLILYEKKFVNRLSNSMDSLVKILKHSEETTEPVTLTECEGNEGRLAKHLANDLEESMKMGFVETPALGESSLLMKYQPQFDNHGKCIGAESLLRWNHAQYGIVYPPLVVHLAKESGRLFDLEMAIIEKSVKDSVELKKVFGETFKLSVNITVSSLNDKRLLPFLKSLTEKYPFKQGSVCIEITEETALETTEQTSALMNSIKEMGFIFALDDFSMGHTSLQYLQYNQFDLVKLDGNLVKSLLGNVRTKEIINSIVYLSKSLGFKVLAEFVETKEQQEALESIGVNLYQGYLYSPAIDKEAFIQFGMRN